ncbi:pyruvate formate lyase activating enzyme [Austwickia chelonae]|uniref:Pyruvate formate-lyase-activating enzyme n=1 Tax=Austwickia chelonae NBRC 105200 TaxID=1184607 RepID=K6VQQ0_9MICO|nr:pyruvate formate-lyase-activating protein [Austwickia chelonae]GAB77695.1 pyruvate formate-lyase-activating enzyme [Austwickia chelonae NBRC 105200]SEW15965.1 pyruvate formate lyase activating enzyme [Austwickia chelonae]
MGVCSLTLGGTAVAPAAVESPDDARRLADVRDGRLGSVHSWELVTAVDGPGTRMTLFLSGCPLRCLYCHNPDTMRARDGDPTDVVDVLNRISRYRGVFARTGGGITVSGGEPLQQPAFLARILRGAKEMGIHTTIDTSGFLGARASDSLLDDVDLVLLDVKSGLPETYRTVTGRDLAPTLAFGERLAQRETPIWIRFVLVPGLTDAPENIEAVADHVAAWGSVQRVEVLPFHQMGRDKWQRLGMTYQLEGTKAPSVDEVARTREVFASRGLTVY